MRKTAVFAVVGMMAVGATAEVLDRPAGIKIGQRMTLRPYVSLSVSWDSNVAGAHGGGGDKGDVLWTVNPGLSLDYRADTWSLLLTGYYNYHAYTKSEYSGRHNQHTYGETLRWNWSNSKGVAKGWTLMLSETFRQTAMSDDLSYGDGSSYTADRYQFTVNGAVQHRFNEHWHADLNASYYMLDYENDTVDPARSALYGWQRWTAGAGLGFAPSRWVDIIGHVGYQGYKQDNVSSTRTGSESYGYTAQAGIGSHATERISYRALAGWSRFEYGDTDSGDGFIYTISGNWKISDTLHTMLLATSYYQPSERERSSKSRVDAVSWGLGKSWVRGKLNSTLDLTYRHETHEGTTYDSLDYEIDVATARAGLHYTLNRFLTGFLTAEYQRSFNDESDRKYGYCDYERWRLTMGVRFTY